MLVSDRINRYVFMGIALASLVMNLAACVSVGPDYVAPDLAASPAWHTPLKGGLVPGDPAPSDLAAWWTTFDDPQLSSLIDRAVKGNLDLKKAKARVREARARRVVARAPFFPTVDASGSGTRSRASDNMTGANYGATGNNYSTLYNAGFDASWELDIFGGTRRSVEAADADIGAREENLRDVLVSLLAETALNYIDVRTYQARIASVEANARAQQDTLQLTLWRSQAGLSDELAVQEARYNLENTRSQVPALRTGLEEAMNRLAVLLGEQPGAIHGYLEKPAPVPGIPGRVAVGVPGDTLRRRPDIRQAERELAAETARVGVAVASLYPVFTLSGNIGVESLSTGNLFSWGSRVLGFGSGVTAPIFHGGAIRGNIEIQSALQEQAAIHYETVLLTALEEVENILTAYAEEQNKRDALRAAEEAAGKAVSLAQRKYEAGLTNFVAVLDAERSLLTFQNQLAQSNGAVTSNLIKLYKALGGGWESFDAGQKATLAKVQRK